MIDHRIELKLTPLIINCHYDVQIIGSHFIFQFRIIALPKDLIKILNIFLYRYRL